MTNTQEILAFVGESAATANNCQSINLTKKVNVISAHMKVTFFGLILIFIGFIPMCTR